MGLFSNPLGHAGYPPNPATATTINSTVRAATAVEAAAGVLNDVYISPATQASAVALDFASPPVLGFGSTTPRPVHATTISATTPIPVTSGGTGAATFTAHGVMLGEGTSALGVTATGTAGQFLVSNGATLDPTFQTATPQLTVTPVAGTTQAMTTNSNYIANAATLTTFTLPTTSAVGDMLRIVGSALNTGGWKITYTTGQIIWGPAGSSTATTGNAASAMAAAQSVTLECVVANTTWVIVANSGTITLT